MGEVNWGDREGPIREGDARMICIVAGSKGE